LNQEYGRLITLDHYAVIKKDIKPNGDSYNCDVIRKNEEVIGRLIIEMVKAHDDPNVCLGSIKQQLNEGIFNLFELHFLAFDIRIRF
jgi:hypothetical protein